MRPQSCKAKGRRFQQFLCKVLLEISEQHGLVADDILNRSMGAQGEDVILSPAARKVFGDLKVEAKNVESLNVVSTFIEHCEKYPSSMAVLMHKRNHTDPMVTLRLSDFLFLLKRSLPIGNN